MSALYDNTASLDEDDDTDFDDEAAGDASSDDMGDEDEDEDYDDCGDDFLTTEVCKSLWHSCWKCTIIDERSSEGCVIQHADDQYERADMMEEVGILPEQTTSSMDVLDMGDKDRGAHISDDDVKPVDEAAPAKPAPTATAEKEESSDKDSSDYHDRGEVSQKT